MRLNAAALAGLGGARLQGLLRQILVSAGVRALNLLVSVAIVPLTLRAVGPAEYAVLAVAISFSAFIAYSDLGLGSALVNEVARNQERAKIAISTTWYLLWGLCFTGALLVSIAYATHQTYTSEHLMHLAPYLLHASAYVLLGIPAGIGQRVLFAIGRMHVVNMWGLGGRLASLLLIWVLVQNGKSNLHVLVFCILGVPCIAGWVLVAIYVLRDKRYRPSGRSANLGLAKVFVLAGISFTAIQLVPYSETGVDSLLAATFIDLRVVPPLDVYSKLFAYVPALASIALYPLWPAVAKALAEGDQMWVRALARRGFLLVGFAASAISLGVLVLAEMIVRRWTGFNLQLEFTAQLGLALYAVIGCMSLFQAMLMNGLDQIGAQARLYVLYAPILVCCKIFCAATFGVSGLVWALVLCSSVRVWIASRMLDTYFEAEKTNVVSA